MGKGDVSMAVRHGNWEDCFAYAAISDIGMKRENNQDEKAVVLAPDFDAWLSRGHVLMVADGMGAHAAGELASKLAVDGVPHLFYKYSHLSPPEALQRAVQETNAEVHRRGQANIDFNNMGTTASVLLLMPQGAVVAHVGDSRVYRLRGRKLEQWTFDHSLVWELRAKGQLPRDQELANAIPKNVITRSLGPYPFIQADIEGPLPLEKGDVYLLCTDGLTGRVSDEELAAVLGHVPFELVPQLLVDIANLRGGPDNVTVVLGRVTDERMETRGLNQPPLTVSGGQLPTRPSPIPWILSSVLMLASLVFLIVLRPQFGVAAATAGLGLASAAWGLWDRHRAGFRGISLQGRRLGKGPYVTIPCRDVQTTLDLLMGLIGQIREQMRQIYADDPTVDDALARRCQEAADEASRGNSESALRKYAAMLHDLAQRA